ncbi:hypothetical protein Kisp01_48070 [Kineosporia sp. NBRC 101677]|nr:hypothetical protein Kisp01_48070 [Kineosporia sp. NBRC 101677]
MPTPTAVMDEWAMAATMITIAVSTAARIGQNTSIPGACTDHRETPVAGVWVCSASCREALLTSVTMPGV